LGQDFHNELQLIHDPRLTLRGSTYQIQGATLDHVESTDESSQAETGHPTDHRPLVRQKLCLTGVSGTKVILSGQFVVRDASGVGDLRLPALRSYGFVVARRWVASTIGPMLNYEQRSVGRVETLGLCVFADVW